MSSISSSLISSVFNSRNTLLDLMEDQGYDIEEHKNFTISEINSMNSREQLDMLLKKRDPENNAKVYIHYFLGKKINRDSVQKIIDDLYLNESILTKEDTLFIVIKDEPNESIIGFLKHIWEQDGFFIIVQSIKRLQFNVLQHALVPPHRIMSATEVAEIKKRYNIMNEGQFPEISRFDPVAQAIGIRPGQVCEISRPSKTAVVAKYYRLCVSK